MGRKQRTEKKKKKSSRQLLRYNIAAMLDAIRDVQQGKPVAQAAREYGVPRISLHYKAKGERPIETRMGPDPILTVETENRIVDWIIKSARTGFPVTKMNLCNSVKKLLDDSGKETPFKNNQPGRKWYEKFLKRHPGLSERMSQNLTSSRANVTSSDLVQWSDSILQFLKENHKSGVLEVPNRLFNGDETAFFLNPKGSAVLAPKGDKTVYQNVNPDEKECLTVLITANASGIMAPPLIVYKYERIPSDIAISVPSDWAIGKSESGWMNGSLFYEYICNSFHPWLLEKKIELPVIFFLDGHSSHLNLQTAQFCHDNGIILISLYPNATHLIQPMDVAVFRSLKGTWKQKVHDWRLDNMANPTLKKKDFAPLLKEVLQQVDPKIISNGFRKCGLYPWNSSAPVKNLLEKEHTTPSPLTPSSTKRVYAKEFVENFLGPQKLKVFQAYNSGSCVPSEDRALFELWKAIHSTPETHFAPTNQDVGTPPPARPELLDVTSSPIEPCSSTQLAATIEDILETRQTTSSVPPTVMQHVSDYEQLTSLNTLPATNPNQDTANLPSPFKRAFLYPEPGPSKPKKSRKRELFPSVISSQAWREYHEKKEMEKQEKELQKNERTRERQRKKAEKEELQKKKKAQREEKKKKGKQVTTKRRTTRSKKNRPLPSSSSESEEWQPSDDDVREEEDQTVAEQVEDISENISPSSSQEDAESRDDGKQLYAQFNDDQGSGQSTRTNIDSEIIEGQSNEDNDILGSLFNVDGLDIDDLEFTHLTNYTGEAPISGSCNIIEIWDQNGRKASIPTEVRSRAAEDGDIPTNEKTEIIRLEKPTRSQEHIAEDLRVEAKRRPAEEEEEKIGSASLEEGQFILARFKKNNGLVELVCRVKRIFSDGCDVVTMKKISRIGAIYSEHQKDMRKIKRDQVLKVLTNHRQFGSNFQFNSADL